MTDGIIQKVLGRVTNDDSYVYDIHTIQTVRELQQELIAEITHEIGFSCPHSYGVCKDCHELTKRIVGE
jgi:hypothetical protein